MEGKLDQLLDKIETETVRTNEHAQRISKLEKWQAWTLGAGTAAGIAVAAIWNVYTLVAHGK